ncbi:efflux RND transporter periplasmic adaptor subunit [Leptospira selangorensis]|uniref:Efflux RND transporter periplasmic adaptor subunit n=1 Tax=Leptospira selangorensis TaxID=2484982 RepID=A0A4R9G3E0_9LEPT|nr:efflux RND transporter periplasmic adaptor subunit [Leptospira selangorensis]TGK05988.1 efflux RND transporter periplasmic adaptor subunit [Leptospira selangorensis]TGM12210.1 efflux RND transporter periplasmic adaptor subunit [Leptospira selangorensis]TGM14747.1 efflux RND transporter periplasmic adaptor subunit [Leptospira selangorensis]
MKLLFQKYKVLIVLALGITIAFFGFKYFSKKKPEKKITEENKNVFTVPEDVIRRHPLTYVGLKEVSQFEELALPGRITYDPESMAKVGSQVEARIKKVLVKEGDKVSQGSPLAILSSIQLGEVEAAYVKARASLDALKMQADRAKELFEMKVTSAKEYEFATMQYKTAKTEVETTRIKLDNYGLTPSEIEGIERGIYVSSNLILRSPINGEVTERKAVLGQQINRNEELFTIANLNHLWVLLDVYEKDLGGVREGAQATIFPLGDEHSSVQIQGKVGYVGTVLDNIKRTAKLRIMVSNKGNKLKPGQTVTAKVAGLVVSTGGGKRKMIPLEAVHEIEGKFFVFIPHGEGSFEAVNVIVGDTIEDDIIILGGLPDGAEVVSKGSFVLKSEFLKF